MKSIPDPDSVTIINGRRIYGLDLQAIDTIPACEWERYAIEAQYAPPAEGEDDTEIEARAREVYER